MDRFNAMRVFVAIAEAGSIGGAAERLGLGQPAVSKTLAALEQHLGVALLVRSTRGSSLTEAGRRYLAHARITLDEAETAEAAARDEAASLRGLLRVAAAPAYANEVIVPRLASFRTRYPEITLDLLLEDRRVDLIAEGIDLALRGGAMNDSTMIARRIDRAARIVVASRSYLEARPTPQHPRDLLAHDWIDYAPWSGAPWRFERGETIQSLTFTPILRVSAAEALRTALLSGLGCGIVSERMIQCELGSPELIRLLPDWELPPGEFWLCSPAGRRISARARAFGTWLDEVVATLVPA